VSKARSAKREPAAEIPSLARDLALSGHERPERSEGKREPVAAALQNFTFRQRNLLSPDAFKQLSDASEIPGSTAGKDTPRVCRARRLFKEKKNR
jgi:hypothetical protein